MPKVSKTPVLRLNDNLDFLKIVSKAKTPKRRREILRTATAEQLTSICDCIHNILYNREISLTDKNKRLLRRHKGVLLVLANKKLPKQTRCEILEQQGGFLPALLAPIIGIAGSLLSNLIR